MGKKSRQMKKNRFVFNETRQFRRSFAFRQWEMEKEQLKNFVLFAYWNVRDDCVCDIFN